MILEAPFSAKGDGLQFLTPGQDCIMKWSLSGDPVTTGTMKLMVWFQRTPSMYDCKMEWDDVDVSRGLFLARLPSPIPTGHYFMQAAFNGGLFTSPLFFIQNAAIQGNIVSSDTAALPLFHTAPLTHRSSTIMTLIPPTIGPSPTHSFTTRKSVSRSKNMTAGSLATSSLTTVFLTSTLTGPIPTSNANSVSVSIPTSVSTAASNDHETISATTSKHVAVGNIIAGAIGGLASALCILLVIAFTRHRSRPHRPTIFNSSTSRTDPPQQSSQARIIQKESNFDQYDRRGTRSDPQRYGETCIDMPPLTYTSVGGNNTFLA